MTYDVYYFIRFFAAIPEEEMLWFLPDCGTLMYDSLAALITTGPHSTAHAFDHRYQQSTPKRRILAALRDVACAQLGPDPEEFETGYQNSYGLGHE